MEPTSVVLDTETNILNVGDGAVGGMKASPYSDRNHIVSIGELILGNNGEDEYISAYDPSGVRRVPEVLRLALAGEKVVLVAHNIGFDLAYLEKEWRDEFYEALPNLGVWCTMQGAYLLSGQVKTMPSLDSEAAAAGLPLKDGAVKAYWDDGVDTSFIPSEILLPYMKQDVYNTADIYIRQVEDMLRIPGMFELAKVKMDDLIMTTLMSINGMKFSVQRAMELVEVLDTELEVLYNDIKELAKPHFIEGYDFNPGSPAQVSALLFGGEYNVVVDSPVLGDDGQQVVYKGGARKGQGKTRKEKKALHTNGFGLSTKGVPKGDSYFSTGDEILSKLNHPFTNLMRQHRERSKDAETYYRGYSALVWPDGCIRPSYNNEIAATGRQTCSAPNLQNVSKGED